jgi:hypothetical protein
MSLYKPLKYWITFLCFGGFARRIDEVGSRRFGTPCRFSLQMSNKLLKNLLELWRRNRPGVSKRSQPTLSIRRVKNSEPKKYLNQFRNLEDMVEYSVVVYVRKLLRLGAADSTHRRNILTSFLPCTELYLIWKQTFARTKYKIIKWDVLTTCFGVSPSHRSLHVTQGENLLMIFKINRC